MIRTLIFFVFLVGCAAKSEQPKLAAFEIELGYNDFYSSSTGEYSRTICNNEDKAKKTFHLTNNQISSIGNIAINSKFFELPSMLPLPANEQGEVIIQSPCETYAINIYYSGLLHHVSWSCNEMSNNKHPKQIRELFNFIKSSLAPVESKMPESKCGYY